MTDNEILLSLSNMLDPIREDIREIKCNIARLENNVVEISTRLKRVELNQENIILPRLETIEACYTSTYERYKNSVEDYDTLKQDMSVVKKVVAEHSKKLQMIS